MARSQRHLTVTSVAEIKPWGHAADSIVEDDHKAVFGISSTGVAEPIVLPKGSMKDAGTGAASLASTYMRRVQGDYAQADRDFSKIEDPEECFRLLAERGALMEMSGSVAPLPSAPTLPDQGAKDEVDKDPCAVLHGRMTPQILHGHRLSQIDENIQVQIPTDVSEPAQEDSREEFLASIGWVIALVILCALCISCCIGIQKYQDRRSQAKLLASQKRGDNHLQPVSFNEAEAATTNPKKKKLAIGDVVKNEEGSESYAALPDVS
jgi:hypothetical protein